MPRLKKSSMLVESPLVEPAQPGINLQEVPDDVFQAEVKRREEIRVAKELAERLERERIAREKRDLRNKLVSENFHVLLALVPEHSRTSCSDANPVNDDRGCPRCALQKLQGEDYMIDYYDFELNISYVSSE